MADSIITPDNYRDHQVRNGELQLVTASSIKLFLRCPLQWYRETVLGQKRPDTEAMDLGRQVHKALETAIMTKVAKLKPSAFVDNPVWVSAQRALDLIGCEGVPEVPMRGELKIAGIPVWSKIDLIRGSQVYDWKTIGTVSRRPSRSTLESDPQKVLYSQWHMLQRKQQSAQFSFVYLSKATPDFRIVSFDVVTEDSEPFTDVVESMKSVAGSKFEPPCTCGKCLQEGQTMTKANQVKTLVIPMEPSAVLMERVPNELELWIDCLPIKSGNYTFLDSLIAERAPSICIAHPTREGVPVDIRCIEFGKGKGYLAEDFRKNPPTGRVVARSGELSDAVVEVLIPLAQEVHIKTR